VLRAKRGTTGSKYVTFQGGLRRIIPFALYWSAAIRKMDHYVGRNDPACICRAG
jgi:hypothetical protein